MDGSNREVLHSTGLSEPNDLAIDYKSQTLYWIDSKFDNLESSHVNGSGRRVLANTATFIANLPFSLDFYDDVMYWSEWALSGSLYSAPVDSAERATRLIPNHFPSRAMMLKIIAADTQPISE